MSVLVFSALVSLLLAYQAYLTFDYHRVRFAKYFILLMLCMAEWTVFYAGEIGFAEVDAKLLCTRLSSPGDSFLSVMWFLFATEYCGVGRNFIHKYKMLFLIEPILSFLSNNTNSLHRLYYSGYSIEMFGEIPIISYEYGPLFKVFYAFSFSLCMLGVFFFINRFISASPALKPQLAILTGGALLPTLGNFLYVLNIGPFTFIDPTAYTFAFAGLVFLGGIDKRDFLSLVPVARENVIDTMKEGYVVVDMEGNIVDINPLALELLGESRKSALGNSFKELFGKVACFSEQWLEGDFSGEIPITKNSKKLFFNITVSPVFLDEHAEGRLIMIRNITEAYLYRQAIEQTNRKINLMSSITRHDILNQVNVLSGYSELLSEILPEDLKENTKMETYLKSLNKSIEKIHSQSIFTKNYEDLGTVPPAWLSARKMAIEAASSISNEGVEVSIEKGDLEVYADPAFQKVFYYLFSNALSRGGNLSKISVRFRKKGAEAVIEVLDNGVGIPQDLKEDIFENAVGRGSEVGLFFVRDASSITGMEIKETGNEKEGAKFEITVPAGNWRAAGSSSIPNTP